MRLDEIVQEQPKGTFAGVRLSPKSVAKLMAFSKEHNIPAPLKADEFHATLLYSRKFLPDYKPYGTFKKPLTATPKELTLLGEIKDSLVVLVDCPALSQRHDYLMKKHDAVWDWPEYKPHVSLSYDAKDFDTSGIDISKLGTLEFVSEYMEDLDFDDDK